jgi:hypothetical protein
MERTTRIVKLSTSLLAEMFTEGNRLNFRVLKGFPADVEIVSGELDWSSTSAPHLNLSVRGFFQEGKDGEIFDIVVQSIHDNA